MLMLIVGITQQARATWVTIGNLRYDLDEETMEATIDECKDPYITELTIPATITYKGKTYAVNCIKGWQLDQTGKPKSPFYDCTRLKVLRIEDSDQPLKERDNGTTHSRALFRYCPIEELYLGRNVPALFYSMTVSDPTTYDGNEVLTKVTVGNKVTEIASSLFWGCRNLTIISLPSVKEIKSYAFRNCSKLTTINLGTELLNIGYGAFMGCGSLTKVTFPETITDIGDSAFKDCNNITEITVGKALKGIGNAAFQNCSALTAVLLPQEFTTLGEYTFQGCSKLTYVELGKSLTSVPMQCFQNCTSLSEITIPGSCKKIEKGAFAGDAGLANIIFEEGVESIGKNAFKGVDAITSLTLPGSLIELKDEAFPDCTNLRYITFSESVNELAFSFNFTNSPITTLIVNRDLDTKVFSKKSTLKTLRFGNAVRNICDQFATGCTSLNNLQLSNSLDNGSLVNIGMYAFENCIALSAVAFPESVETIGYGSFSKCTGLNSVQLNDSLVTIEGGAFEGCISLSDVTVPETVESIGYRSFSNCTGLTDIHFRESLTHGLKINSQAFEYCPIQTLTIPAHATYIGNKAFYECRDLLSLTIIENKEYKPNLEIQPGAFSYTNLREVEIPARVTTIDGSFQEIPNLEKVIICDGADELNFKRALISSPVKSLYIGRNLTSIPEKAHISEDTRYGFFAQISTPNSDLTEVRFSQSGTVTEIPEALFYNVRECENLELPDGLKSIGDRAFSKMVKLNGIVIPNSVTELGVQAFADDISLKSARLSENCVTIPESCFANCSMLGEITIPSGTNKVEPKAFSGCESLTSVGMLDSSETLTFDSGNLKESPLASVYFGRNVIGDSFQDKPALTTIQFSNAGTVTFLCEKQLMNASGCEALLLPNSLLEINDYALSGMRSLQSLVIPEKVTLVGNYALSDNTSLATLKLPSRLSQINRGLCYNCTSLKGIVIPGTVSSILSSAFVNCNSLETLSFEDGEEFLYLSNGNDAVQFNKSPLTELYIGRWLQYDDSKIELLPFANKSTIKKVTFGDYVKLVEKYMFYKCTGIEEVNLSKSVESVGAYSFYECSSLKQLKFTPGIMQISDFAFAKCSSLDNVTFPSSMTSVSVSSFEDCTSLENLDLGNSLYIIGPSAFRNCTKLNGIEIPESLYGLGVQSFENCISLPNVTIRSISSVGKQAFKGCTGLKWVSLSNKTTSLGEDSFAGCTGIEYVKSYAEFPPEGLVNFPEEVVANGVLFVPENSVDYYRDSPTWEDWDTILPDSDQVFVTAVTISSEAETLKVSESIRLEATAIPSYAFNTDIIWRSSNTDVAVVDEDGLVTALAVGTATISATAADGSNRKAECVVTVASTLAERIEISADATKVRKGRTIQLTATVYPADATNTEVSWISSNPNFASVTEDGTVTGKLVGEVIITARAKDESGVTGTYALSVVGPTKGDSNDNDVVTITDAVNTANYAVGNEVDDFCFEAADVNSDNRITMSDASLTIDIILNQEIDLSTHAMARAIARVDGIEADMLVIDDYKAKAGETETLFVHLDNSIEYVAMQADIVVPEGMTLCDIKFGDRAAQPFTRYPPR